MNKLESRVEKVVKESFPTGTKFLDANRVVSESGRRVKDRDSWAAEWFARHLSHEQRQIVMIAEVGREIPSELTALLEQFATESSGDRRLVLWHRRSFSEMVSQLFSVFRRSRFRRRSFLGGETDTEASMEGMGWRFASSRAAIPLILDAICPRSLCVDFSAWFPALCLSTIHYFVPKNVSKEYDCTIIIPARNEAGNVREIWERLPRFGRSQEIVFVEGHSSDRTREEIETFLAEDGDRAGKLVLQTGKGKWDAVQMGIRESSCELVFILDADLSVDPEALGEIYHEVCEKGWDFINGTRFVHSMEAGAMQTINYFANKAFAWWVSVVMSVRVSDSLCGTKVFFRKHLGYVSEGLERIEEADPFGDYSMLFRLREVGGQLMDYPVHYRARRYGTTNIARWRDGVSLAKVVTIAMCSLRSRRDRVVGTEWNAATN